MVWDAFCKYSDGIADWCPHCEYKTNERFNLDTHVKLNHQSASSSTNEELIDAIGKYTNLSPTKEK